MGRFQDTKGPSIRLGLFVRCLKVAIKVFARNRKVEKGESTFAFCF